jgi:hypothetical protein
MRLIAPPVKDAFDFAFDFPPAGEEHQREQSER